MQGRQALISHKMIMTKESLHVASSLDKFRSAQYIHKYLGHRLSEEGKRNDINLDNVFHTD